MTADVDRLMTVAEVSALTSLSPSTLYDWASKGKDDGPRTFRLGGRRVYHESAVRDWIDSQDTATGSGGQS